MPAPRMLCPVCGNDNCQADFVDIGDAAGARRCGDVLMIAKILLVSGGGLLALLLAARFIEVAAESYGRDGWHGLVAGLIVLYAYIGFVVGLLLYLGRR